MERRALAIANSFGLECTTHCPRRLSAAVWRRSEREEPGERERSQVKIHSALKRMAWLKRRNALRCVRPIAQCFKRSCYMICPE